jgi:molecular chaperone DnaK
MAQLKAVGIDLGTSNSAVAWTDASGRTAMIRNIEGDLLTPSVVLFDDEEVVVGKEARNALTVKPDRVAQWVKRDMGSPVYSRPIRGEYLPPEVIQACVLRKLKADILYALGPDFGVVITVPAYFDEPRRQATVNAGEMAGLNVLDIVNEPTAAALAFGESLGYLTPDRTGAKTAMAVMVYDLGGGTFDATMLQLGPGEVRTLATDGDVQLGGHDWDLRLLDLVAESFKQFYGVDPRNDPAGLNRLYNSVVEAKHALSARTRVTIRVEQGEVSGEIQVTREQFEEITADLLDRTAYTTRQLLAAIKLSWNDVQRVLLVGGSTRMPMVSRMLARLTQLDPAKTVNPDEAVARGAAIYAAHLLEAKQGGSQPASFQVTNVNAHSLGVQGIEPQTLRKTNVVLIPRNSPLPARFTERFVTKSDNQRTIVVQVLEGESSQPAECSAIGRAVIRDLPPGLPQGWPVDVTFEYGANGRLSVEAVVSGTQNWTSLQIERSTGLSSENLHGWQQAVASTVGFGAFGPMLNDPSRPQAAAAAAPTFASAAPPGSQAATSLLSHAASGRWETVARPDLPVSGGLQPSAAPTSGWPSATVTTPAGPRPATLQPVVQPQPTLPATETAAWSNPAASEVHPGAQPPPLGSPFPAADTAEVLLVDEAAGPPSGLGRFFRGRAIKIAGLVLATVVVLVVGYLIVRHSLPKARKPVSFVTGQWLVVSGQWLVVSDCQRPHRLRRGVTERESCSTCCSSQETYVAFQRPSKHSWPPTTHDQPLTTNH